MEDDRYGLPELRRLMSTAPHFPAISHPHEPFSLQRSLDPGSGIPLPQPSIQFGPIHRHVFPDTRSHYNPPSQVGFATGGDPSPRRPPVSSGAVATTLQHGAEAESSGDRLMEIGSSCSRWPRQETLTLLEIRSRLDSKFKEANHKGPLWDEVSRYIVSFWS